MSRLDTEIRRWNALIRVPRYRLRFVLQLLAFLGVFASAFQVLIWSLGSRPNDIRTWLLILLPAGFLVVAYTSRPPVNVDLVSQLLNARITIQHGSLLTASALPRVITTNRNFDAEPPWADRSSLIGQLSARWFGDGNERLMTSLIAAHVESGASAAQLGEVLRLAHEDDEVALLAVSRRHDEYGSQVLVDEVWTALNMLWKHARTTRVEGLVLPVVGSGLAQARVGRLPLLLVMLTSYITASAEQPVCPIVIVLPDSTIGSGLLEVAREVCQQLGFRTP